ncbi:hypothetical protein V8G54_026763 [Vigna mungo]|uniref:Lysosomal Pro-X carboxypeptidase n=1 Tax=Vigna mungo TaxID=3915 RepID=A0AAQ3RQ83_VIGMU
MEHHLLLFQCLLFSFLMYFTSTLSVKIPRLSPIPTWDTRLHHPATFDAKNIKTFYYKQLLDHFNHRPGSYKTFQQRYFINFKYWGGANSSAPIFAYLGAEEVIDYAPEDIAFLTDNAASFNALLVYIEHRYYGKSVPSKNARTMGYFNSAQAIADYASVLIHVKKTLHAPNSPVIVIGGSYGGMLASWFRLKYPHIAIGALASSAPILYFDDITPHDGYYNVVSRDFREASETCYQTILKSWNEIDTADLSFLSHRFNTCRYKHSS